MTAKGLRYYLKKLENLKTFVQDFNSEYGFVYHLTPTLEDTLGLRVLLDRLNK